MKLLISDIHSNIKALETVAKYTATRDIEEIYCLGDIIGYGENPNECIELLQTMNAKCLLGNHETLFLKGSDSEKYNFPHTRAVIKEKNLAFLEHLPTTIEPTEYNAIFTHTFPVGTMHYIYPNSDFTVFNNAIYKYYFIAHTHRPMYLTYYDKKIINPGSVGQPRDGDNRPSIVCFDLNDDYFEFKRI